MMSSMLLFYKTKAKTHLPGFRCGREMKYTAENLVIPNGIKEETE